MKNYLLAILLFLPFTLFSQAPGKSVEDAFLITRMAAKFHVQPRPVDDQFSNIVFSAVIKHLDEEKLLFTKQDITKLEPFRYQLDDEIKNRKADFLSLLTSVYKDRIQQAALIINKLVSKPLNYSNAETLTVAESTNYVTDTTAMRIKISKVIKSAALQDLSKVLIKDSFIFSNKNRMDSVLAAISIKNQKSYKRYIDELQQDASGIEKNVSDAYCKAIANCFDPHTEYFPLTEKENFESQLGNKPFLFGFSLSQSDNEGLVINDLMPGSPAFKCGMLNKGDKILSIQWENKQPIDVSDASRKELDAVLNASNHDKATFTVKKADGSTRQVILIKELISDDADAEDAVKSFILKGEKNIGFIILPAFYTSWEKEAEQDLGCAGDVAKEIIKLKKENIQGLIIDLRYNGGGSMQEAVALAGIFIDGGPVCQVNDRNEKTYTLKDVNRGTVYDGPLIIMVNGYSASASEMLAGTLQDYNRAVIIGSNTYGKATAQVILPLDTTINLNSKPPKNNAASYLKITVSELYRVTGNTAQFTGVHPDIILPDALEITGERESSNPTALNVPPIDANKYYRPYAAIQKDALQAEALKEIASEKYFEKLKVFTQAWLKNKTPKDILLQQSAAVAQTNSLKGIGNPEEDTTISTPPFTIINNAYEQQQINANSKRKEFNDNIQKYLLKDPYVNIAFRVAQLMK